MNNEKIKTISESSKNIADEIRKQMIDLENPNRPNTKQAKLADYRLFCEEYLEGIPEIITDDLVKEALDIVPERTFKEFFKPGHRCCVTVVPCSRYGNELAPNDIENGLYLVTLIISPDGATIQGFTSDPSYIFNIQPREIVDQCTFDIGDYELTENDRLRIMASYKQALTNAQKIFNEA